MNLSGGQQARINLARAVYRDSDIYLLDDSLSALDSQVQDYIFDNCIKKLLVNKIVVLVSQTPYHIEKADCVIVLSKGTIKISGKPSKELLTEVSMMTMTNVEITENHNEKKRKVNENEIEENIEEENSPLTGAVEGHKTIYGEVKKKGEVDFATYKKYFAFGGGFCLLLINALVSGVGQGAESYSSMLLSHW